MTPDAFGCAGHKMSIALDPKLLKTIPLRYLYP
jgi:hypothetical protein